MNTNEERQPDSDADDAGADALDEPADSRFPTAAELTALFGVAMSDRLEPKKIHRLRKSFPGYASTLRTVAETMREEETDPEGDPLRVRGLTATEVEELREKLVPLIRAEKALHAAYRAAYEQRMMVDDRAMEVMRKVQRAVVGSEDPDLAERWRFLGEFLGAFSGGRPAGKSATAGESDEEVAAPAAGDRLG